MTQICILVIIVQFFPFFLLLPTYIAAANFLKMHVKSQLMKATMHYLLPNKRFFLYFQLLLQLFYKRSHSVAIRSLQQVFAVHVIHGTGLGNDKGNL